MSSSRDAIVALDAQGISTPNIAMRLGLTQSLVERTLDKMAGATETPITGAPRPAPAAVAKPAAPPRPVVTETTKALSCGTRAGYIRHRKHREEACEPCKEAAAAYQRERVAVRQSKPIATPRKKSPAKKSAPTSAMPPRPVLSEVGQQAIADAAAGRTRVRWLVPPHGQDSALEYAIAIGGVIHTVGPASATMYAGDGTVVYARRVTPWAPIPHTGEVAS